MAQVGGVSREHMDSLLDYLIDAWRGLPQAERDINQWDLIEQIDYVEEWTPKIDWLSRLEGYAADGLLDESQELRLAELRHLVGEHQPILTRLRQS
jgi:hypothetical protein